ncbi:hypothetical protein AVEN_28537-1 [Araneus ventricosus]|uniref:Uncharacterized protein n=1 Tax=Araneus ventricosus TaxID=182803 RepID=A0A4Y2USK5_ARAVE|nr:hypothetical protein AVEN_274831-1 [Araneus ventricosus]GBO15183.1 hypothetical protein AVEN_28537-1 [Araneus ventricosus]
MNHAEFLLRLMATMLCWNQHSEFVLDASKIMILMLNLKRNAPEELEVLFHEDSCETLVELAKSSGVDHTTVSKHLKTLEIIQKLCHWVPYQLKQRDVERRLFSFLNSCFKGRKGHVLSIVS